jgi:hypothetical protein
VTKANLITLIESGAKLHQSEAMAANDYRPNRSTTEYLLTAAIMRAALKESEHVSVEMLCRKLVNVITSSASSEVRKSFGKKRFDILIGEALNPQAIVEVKIGVRSGKKLLDDVNKILKVTASLDRMRVPAIGMLVFEIDVPGSGTVAIEQDFKSEFERLYSIVKSDLCSSIKTNWPLITIDFHLLTETIWDAEIVDETIAENGAAIFICAATLETQTLETRSQPLPSSINTA